MADMNAAVIDALPTQAWIARNDLLKVVTSRATLPVSKFRFDKSINDLIETKKMDRMTNKRRVFYRMGINV